MQVSFNLSYIRDFRISLIIRVIPLFNFVPNSERIKFGHGTSGIAMRDTSKQMASACYLQHLVMVADVARCYLHGTMIVTCSSHTVVSFV